MNMIVVSLGCILDVPISDDQDRDRNLGDDIHFISFLFLLLFGAVMRIPISLMIMVIHGFLKTLTSSYLPFLEVCFRII